MTILISQMDFGYVWMRRGILMPQNGEVLRIFLLFIFFKTKWPKAIRDNFDIPSNYSSFKQYDFCILILKN